MNVEQELNAYVSEDDANIYTQKSEIWNSLLALRGKASFDFCQMESFLSSTSGAATGTGDVRGFGKRLPPALEYLSEKLDKTFLDQAPASDIGHPPEVTVHSVKSNLAHLWNLARLQDYVHYLSELKKAKEDGLDILEIGPGYGCGAHILITLGLVRSYTCVDLKENLGNSVFFLTRNHPDRNVQFIRSKDDVVIGSNRLNFVLASKFYRLENVQFDAVLNTDSFGEMPAETAIAYIRKIPNLLHGDGLFISMNGHRRGQYELSGVKKVSDYGYDQFEMKYFTYKSYFSSSMDGFGHLAVCKKSDEAPLINKKAMDVLSDLFAMGINEDIQSTVNKFNSSKLDESDLKRIDNWDAVLASRDFDEGDNISRYIKFVRNVATEKRFNGEEYKFLLNNLESAQAQYILRLCRAICTSDWNFWQDENLSRTQAFLISDLERFRNASKLKKVMFLELRRAHLKKKFYPRDKYKLPAIIKLRRVLRI